MPGKNKNVAIPENVDWSKRAIPSLAAQEEGLIPGSWAHWKRKRQITKENKAYMRHVSEQQDHRVVAYHATTAASADRIREEGIRNGLDVREFGEDNDGVVFAFDKAVLGDAIAFAKRRAKEAKESGNGVIVKVMMDRPMLDNSYGRLEWHADESRVHVDRILTPEQALQEMGHNVVSELVELQAS